LEPKNRSISKPVWDHADKLNLPKPYIVFATSLGAMGAARAAIHDKRISAALLLVQPENAWRAIDSVCMGIASPIAHLINVTYKWDILQASDIRGVIQPADHNPLVCGLMGSRDKYDIEKTKSAFAHWRGECGWDLMPNQHPHLKKFFMTIPDAVHYGQEGKQIHEDKKYDAYVEAFFDRVVNSIQEIPPQLTQTQQASPQPSTYWQLVWSDDFDGPTLDYSKWECEVNNFGGGNEELQFYTDRKKNVKTENGCLIIEAYKEKYSTQGAEEKEYTSGRIRSKHRGDWKYGRFEIRAKIPFGRGIWPAIWMLPTDEVYGTWASSGEIDIVEANGRKSSEIFGTLHFGGCWPDNKQTPETPYVLQNPQEFHVFALEWDENKIRWFVDGKCFAERSANEWSSTAPNAKPSAPFDQNFHLIFNIAVGGKFTDAPDTTSFSTPQQLVIDWVRVYQAM